MKIELYNGIYTYVIEDRKQYALHYGEMWRDVTGDDLIYAMACEIERLREENEELEFKVDELECEIYCNRADVKAREF
jgi:hypothetical protein